MSVTEGVRPHTATLRDEATRPRAPASLIVRVGRVLLALALAASMGCYNVPAGKSAISKVTISGVSGVDEDDLADHITTRETSRFLGIIYGFVYDYELFDRHALGRDLARVERYMHARGFYDAHVKVARVVPDPTKARVEVEIEVEQGRPFLVDTVVVTGDETVSSEARRRLRRAITSVLPEGARLDEAKLEESEKAATRALTSRGHAAARVERRAEVDLATATARLTFAVTAGPLARIGKVQWRGLDELPEGKVAKVFAIKEGDRCGIL